jgi:hypothetical protein
MLLSGLKIFSWVTIILNSKLFSFHTKSPWAKTPAPFIVPSSFT